MAYQEGRKVKAIKSSSAIPKGGLEQEQFLELLLATTSDPRQVSEPIATQDFGSEDWHWPFPQLPAS